MSKLNELKAQVEKLEAAISKKVPRKKVTEPEITNFCNKNKIACKPADAKEAVKYLNGKRLSEDYDKLSEWGMNIIDAYTRWLQGKSFWNISNW